MFKIEIIDLLSKIKNADNDLEANNLKTSLKRLIFQNISEYESFKNSGNLDEQTLQFLSVCENEIESEQEQKNNDSIQNSGNIENQKGHTEIENIKRFFSTWNEYFERNNHIPDENCVKIIEEIIRQYMPDRFGVIQNILEMDFNENFNAFKNMLNNYLRQYFAEKIEEYLNSEKYTKKWFLSKKRKDTEIKDLINNIGEYNFDIKKMEEVLN